MGIFGYLMELDSQGSKVNKGYAMEMIDIALILAFLWFGLSLVQWTDKQDN